MSLARFNVSYWWSVVAFFLGAPCTFNVLLWRPLSAELLWCIRCS